MTITIKLPKWATDAQRLRDEGKTIQQIVDILETLHKVRLSESRVSQLTSSAWYHNAMKEQIKSRTRTDELVRARLEGRKPNVNAAQREAIEEYNREHGLLTWATRKKEEELMLSQNRFEAVSSGDPTDVHHRVRINCSHDGCLEQATFKKRGIISPDAASKWFVQQGWIVGSSKRADLCPEHARGVRMEKPKVEYEIGGVALVPATLAGMKSSTAANSPIPMMGDVDAVDVRRMDKRAFEPASPPKKLEPSPKSDPVEEKREMTKLDRRIIINKVDEVYETDVDCYKATWTDLKVAQDLGVPVEWVAEIRDENFGPAINEEELKRIEAEEIERFKNSLIEEAKAIIAKDKERNAAKDAVIAANAAVDIAIDAFDIALETFGIHDNETVNLLKLFNERLTVFNYKAGVK